MSLVGAYKRNFLAGDLAVVVALWLLVLLTGVLGSAADGALRALTAEAKDLLAILAALYGALFGFIITSLSVIIALSSHPHMHLVRKSKAYPLLWRSFSSTIRYLALATIVSLVSLVLVGRGVWVEGNVYAGLLLALIVMARLGRSIWILEKVVALVAQPAPGP